MKARDLAWFTVCAALGCGGGDAAATTGRAGGDAGAGGGGSAGSAGTGAAGSSGGSSSSSSSTDGGASGGGGGADCRCDCPDGPPPPCDVDAGPCPIDGFCSTGKGVCCLGAASTGICRDHECAACWGKEPAFSAPTACWTPTCCDATAGALDLLCVQASAGALTEAFACAGAPASGPETDGRTCAPLEVTATCGWDGVELDAVVLCCGP